ncbi:MAG: dUTP diphosphatase [Armatimonadota bacterium]
MAGGRPLKVPIVLEPEGEGLELPRYATAGSAGMDLRAAVEDDLTIAPGERYLFSCGFRMALPEGYEAQVRPRSGLALRHGITLLNAPGTIDSDYRGTVSVIVANLGHGPVVLRRGERVAQMVVAPVTRAELVETDELPDTDRGGGGFGHTGRQ